MTNIAIKEADEWKCDLCQRIFYRKWVRTKNSWSQINNIDFWTEDKIPSDYKIICRLCLKNWFEKLCRNYAKVLSPKKKKQFYHYRYSGLLDKGREPYKDE